MIKKAQAKKNSFQAEYILQDFSRSNWIKSFLNVEHVLSPTEELDKLFRNLFDDRMFAGADLGYKTDFEKLIVRQPENFKEILKWRI